MKNIIVLDDHRIDFEIGKEKYALTISNNGFFVERKENGGLVSDDKATKVENALKRLR